MIIVQRYELKCESTHGTLTETPEPLANSVHLSADHKAAAQGVQLYKYMSSASVNVHIRPQDVASSKTGSQ